MEEVCNLEGITKEISENLFDSISLLEVLDEFVGEKRKEGVILSSIRNKIRKSFDNIEVCRSLISVPDK